MLSKENEEFFSAAKVWGKIFGWEVQSRTNPSKKPYKVVHMDEAASPKTDGWKCSCPDWIFRRGSSRITKTPDGKYHIWYTYTYGRPVPQGKAYQTCPHIIHVMKQQGLMEG